MIFCNTIAVMSEQEYLDSKGVGSAFSGSSLDKCRFPHGLTTRAHKNMMKIVDKIDDDYYNRRNQAKNEYHRLIAEGKIRDYTKEEKQINHINELINKANGDDNFESTLAARRMCEKRGIDWKRSIE